MPWVPLDPMAPMLASACSSASHPPNKSNGNQHCASRTALPLATGRHHSLSLFDHGQNGPRGADKVSVSYFPPIAIHNLQLKCGGDVIFLEWNERVQ